MGWELSYDTLVGLVFGFLTACVAVRAGHELAGLRRYWRGRERQQRANGIGAPGPAV